MAQSALDRIREMDQQKLTILAEAEAAALTRATEALKELKELVREHLKAAETTRR